MDIDLTVSRVEGPTVGGSMRGVKFMQMGFIQNLDFVHKRGIFTGFTPDRARVSNLEGLGVLLDSVSAADVPWYHRTAASSCAWHGCTFCKQGIFDG